MTEGQYLATTEDSSTDPLAVKITYREQNLEKLDSVTLEMHFYTGSGCSGKDFKTVPLMSEDGEITYSSESPGDFSFNIWQSRNGEVSTTPCLGSVFLGTPTFEITSATAPLSVSQSTDYILAIHGTCTAENSSVAVDLGKVLGGAIACKDHLWAANVDFSNLAAGSYQTKWTSTYRTRSTTLDLTLVKVAPAIPPGGSTTPIMTGAISDGSYLNSLTSSPTLSWVAAIDDTGIARYEIAIGSTPGSINVVGWTDFGSATSQPYIHTSNIFTNGTTYYPSLRAVDLDGNLSNIITGDGWTVDTLPPAIGDCSNPPDSWSRNYTPPISWSLVGGAGVGSPLARIEVQIGRTLGAGDLVAWTSVGVSSPFNVPTPVLDPGGTYHAMVKAFDSAGNVSAPFNCNPSWMVKAEQWTTNGIVSSMVKFGNSVYLGGSFSRVGPWTGGGVQLTPLSGQVMWSAPSNMPKQRVAGKVLVSIPDQAGGFYIGGVFTHIGGEPVRNLAHIHFSGTLDKTFRPDPTGFVNALALNGSHLFVGGGFDNIGGLARHYIADVSPSTGTANAAFNAHADNSVMGIQSLGSILYVNGNFANIGGLPRYSLAAIYANDGVGFSDFNPQPNAQVLTTALGGTNLYVGGNFTEVGGASRYSFAAVDIHMGTAISGINIIANAAVNTLLISGTTLYMGGEFEVINTMGRSRIAAIDLITHTLRSDFNPGADGSVLSLTMVGSKLVAGGNFSTIGGLNRPYIAAVNTDGTVISAFDAGATGPVSSLANNGTSIFAGGSFQSMGSVVRNSIAAIDLTSGQAKSSFNPDSNGVINALAISPDGTTLYAGGWFSRIGGQNRNYLAEISTDTGQTRPSDFQSNGVVNTLAIGDDTLFVGGGFSSIGGSSRLGLAAFDSSNRSLVSSFNANSDSSVQTIVVSGSTLYVGGSFNSIGGLARPKLAALLASTGSGVSAFNASVNDIVFALAVSGTNLYVGGDFTTLGGLARPNLGAVSLGTGSGLAAFAPSPNGRVLSLAADSSTLYVGGRFSSLGGLSRNFLGAVSLSTGSGASAFAPAPDNQVNALLLTSDTLYTGGAFTVIGPSGGGGYCPLSPNTATYLPEL